MRTTALGSTTRLSCCKLRSLSTGCLTSRCQFSVLWDLTDFFKKLNSLLFPATFLCIPAKCLKLWKGQSVLPSSLRVLSVAKFKFLFLCMRLKPKDSKILPGLYSSLWIFWDLARVTFVNLIITSREAKITPRDFYQTPGISRRKEKGFLIAFWLSPAMAALEGIGPAT